MSNRACKALLHVILTPASVMQHLQFNHPRAENTLHFAGIAAMQAAC
jgi:hypothetical protein